MKTQRFGIEIEMTGLTRSAAAKIIAGHFGTSAVHIGGGYDTYTVRDDDDRQWKLVSDASIRCESRNGENASKLYSVEFVSPICHYEDIETNDTGTCQKTSSGRCKGKFILRNPCSC